MAKSPAVILYDSSGNPMDVEDGVAIPAGTKSLLISGEDGTGEAHHLKTSPEGTLGVAAFPNTSFIPDPSDRLLGDNEVRPLSIDSIGTLRTRSQVLTDEGVFRDTFSTALESNLTGSVTFINGSTFVAGSGTAFLSEVAVGQYLRRSTHAQTAYVSVLKVISDTALLLEEPYAGGFSTGTATVSYWVQSLPSGASISTSGSELSITAPTTTGTTTGLSRGGDYQPMVMTTRAKVSQRIANQEVIMGLSDGYPSPVYQSAVVFDGTDFSKLKFRTSSTTHSVDLQETIVDLTELDLNFNTVDYHDYRIVVVSSDSTLFVDGVEVASHTRGVMGPYDVADICLAVVNTSTVTATTLTVNKVLYESQNVVHVTTGAGEVRVNQGNAAPTKDAWPVTLVSSKGDPALFGHNGRLATSPSHLLFYDHMESSSVDPNRWVVESSTLTASQASGVLTLNNGASTAVSTYYNLSSAKRLASIAEYGNHILIRARVQPRQNATVSLGLGVLSGTSDSADGAFFRFRDGNLYTILTYNGSETSVQITNTPNSTDYYAFEITLFESEVHFNIRSNDGKYEEHVGFNVPATSPSHYSVSHLPVFARVVNGNPGPSSAAVLYLSNIVATQLDVAMNKPWSEQLAGSSLSSIVDPATHAQTANYANSAAPSSATLSNTTPGYTTLGGLFQFAAPAGAETDYVLFAYQPPISPGRQLYVWSVVVTALNVGASVSSQTPTVVQWAIAANSSGASLATGAPNPPIRVPIGIQSVTKGSTIGDLYSPPIISYVPRTPIVVFPGRYFQVIARVPYGVATSNQVVRGTVTIEGYFE